MESRMARVVWVERPRAPAPALSIAAIGASRRGMPGVLPVWAPVSELTQWISRKRRNTCWKANSEPIARTPRMSPLRPGLALKASSICLYRIRTTNPTSARNAAMPTRKMRGDVSRRMSESIAMDCRIEPQKHADDRAGSAIIKELTAGRQAPPPRLRRSAGVFSPCPAVVCGGQATFNFGLSHPRLASTSAICTALSAAPLRRLSDTTQRLRPLSIVGSSRMRLM